MKIKFDMIGLFVDDLTTMVHFYNKVVGIEIEWDGEGPYAEFKHDGIRFAMYERKILQDLLGKTPTFASGLNGTFELAINVGAKENVDMVYNRMKENGAQEVYAPRNEPWKMRSSMISDPEGNLIEIGSDFWE
jgi:lactoylglutathione lyase